MCSRVNAGVLSWLGLYVEQARDSSSDSEAGKFEISGSAFSRKLIIWN